MPLFLPEDNQYLVNTLARLEEILNLARLHITFYQGDYIFAGVDFHTLADRGLPKTEVEENSMFHVRFRRYFEAL